VTRAAARATGRRRRRIMTAEDRRAAGRRYSPDSSSLPARPE
jgi:hypothetical protein